LVWLRLWFQNVTLLIDKHLLCQGADGDKCIMKTSNYVSAGNSNVELAGLSLF